MKKLITALSLVLVLGCSLIAAREYEVRKVQKDIAQIIANTPEFSKLSIRRAKPGMLELQGSFATAESLRRFTSAVDSFKAKRLFFKPRIIYPPKDELIKPRDA